MQSPYDCRQDQRRGEENTETWAQAGHDGPATAPTLRLRRSLGLLVLPLPRSLIRSHSCSNPLSLASRLSVTLFHPRREPPSPPCVVARALLLSHSLVCVPWWINLANPLSVCFRFFPLSYNTCTLCLLEFTRMPCESFRKIIFFSFKTVRVAFFPLFLNSSLSHDFSLR